MNPHTPKAAITEITETMGSAAAAHVESIFTRHLSLECNPPRKDNREIFIQPTTKGTPAMNSVLLTLPPASAAAPHVEFFRLPAPGKRDPHFGLSRGWYYKAADLGEIKMVAVRQRGALRGVRLVVYDSVADYIRRSMGGATAKAAPFVPAAAAHVLTQANLPSADEARA